MSIKAKISLIVWAIITFIGWWGIFVYSLLNDKATQTTAIIQPQNQFKPTKDTKQNKNTPSKPIQQKQSDNKQATNKISKTQQAINNKKQNSNQQNLNTTPKEKKSNYPNLKHTTFTILAPKNLISNIAWKIFKYKFKKQTWWNIQLKFYQNEIDYNKDLIYKLVTKSNDFDLAIIPAYWYNQIKKVSSESFKAQNININLSTLFDYNFDYFLHNNDIKAIPFAIDPIIWFTNKKLSANITIDNWKNLIINSPNRLTPDGNKIQTMPLFLWYDKRYLNFIKNNEKSLFPVFDFILKYYIENNAKEKVNFIKELWNSIIYKTFDFWLTQRYFIWYRKFPYCKGYEKYCLLLDKKSNLVYWFTSDNNWFKANWIKIFKNFRFFIRKIKKVAVPLANFQAEYPARWWIIIINPNSKNLSKLWKFLQAYILMWQENKLPFYKNLISPFVKNQKVPDNISFLQNYLGRFILLRNLNINYPKTITEKEINFLLGTIGFEALKK